MAVWFPSKNAKKVFFFKYLKKKVQMFYVLCVSVCVCIIIFTGISVLCTQNG